MSTRLTHWTDTELRGACDDAVTWARAYPTFAAAYQACDRGDWLAWLVVQRGLDAEAIATAQRAFAEAIATAQRAYAEAIRAAVPFTLIERSAP